MNRKKKNRLHAWILPAAAIAMLCTLTQTADASHGRRGYHKRQNDCHVQRKHHNYHHRAVVYRSCDQPRFSVYIDFGHSRSRHAHRSKSWHGHHKSDGHRRSNHRYMRRHR